MEEQDNYENDQQSQHKIYTGKSFYVNDTDDDVASLPKKTLKVLGRHLNSTLMELNRQSTRRCEFTLPIKIEPDGKS